MSAIDILGFVAATCTTISFLPQVIKTYRTKSVEDISLVMYIIFMSGLIMWLIYGLVIRNFPIIFSNIVTISLAATILYFKFKYNKKS
ncbi:MAG: SemiSWEET transporter [Saprospiraceae bacterium]|nr:SemiSWEET transporter [Bacteroidia bacterium]MBT8230088.1 SemiSWEET transporter [Bacteroidia bacterium]NNF23012.1 SemiSWEET transporter [Saprospiraceae bacterium]NNK89533.1 SemiSWEET transporter [Saprospiraceae bacterium]